MGGRRAQIREQPKVPGMPRVVQALAAHFGRLPGVGDRTALRFATFMAMESPSYARAMAAALDAVSERVVGCAHCNALAERAGDPPFLCGVCSDHKRDGNLICVVARQVDVITIEKTGAMRGRYYVLGNLVSPLDGISLDDLPVNGLLRAIARGTGNVEVLLALPATVEGDATVLALRKELASAPGVRVTAIARGVPNGSDIEFTDALTLARAFIDRAEVRT
jgi:recombination protein RecR